MKKTAAPAKPTRKSIRAPLHPFVEPALATLVEDAPTSANWRHEIKYDGYRLLAAVNAASVKLYTRTGLD